jgi:hypothetical protein
MEFHAGNALFMFLALCVGAFVLAFCAAAGWRVGSRLFGSAPMRPSRLQAEQGK